jgi:hypothetical protein
MWYMKTMEHLATSTCRHETTLLATEVIDLPSTPLSTTIATRAKQVASRRHKSKHGHSRRHVTTKRSIVGKMVDYVFDPLHARFDFTVEGCADDEGHNSHA